MKRRVLSPASRCPTCGGVARTGAVTLESTTKIVELRSEEGGRPLPARVWQGRTESGIPVHAYITRIAVPDDERQEQFERELRECRAPSPEVEAIPLRMIL